MRLLHPAATDEDLAARAGRGDAPAFDALVGRYSARVVALLVRSCGVPPGDAEDVAQDVWVKVWRALPAWVPGHFRGWLFTVARNAADDARRKLARRRAGPLADADPPAPAAPVGLAAEHRDEVHRLGRCLDRLPPEFRSAFEGFAGGQTYEELAAAAGAQVGTVKSRLSRAREALRKCMGVGDG